MKYNDRVLRLSALEPDWGNVVKQEMRPKEYFFKILK